MANYTITFVGAHGQTTVSAPTQAEVIEMYRKLTAAPQQASWPAIAGFPPNLLGAGGGLGGLIQQQATDHANRRQHPMGAERPSARAERLLM